MKIVVLGGGISTERSVSLVTATSVCRALRDAERLDLAFDAVEAYLAFEIVGVNHVFMNQR